MGGDGDVNFEQTKDRLVLKGLPAECPDDIAHYAVLKIEFDARPRQELGYGCVIVHQKPARKAARTLRRARKLLKRKA